MANVNKFVTDETLENTDVVTQLKEDLTTKLTEPSTAAVGQYFRVASIDSDGHAVLEAVDLPAATGNSLGVVKQATGGGYGIRTDAVSNGTLSVFKATDNDVTGHSNQYRPIVPSNLVKAVDSVLCSTTASEALTTTQQAAARARLGAANNLTPTLVYDETLTEEKTIILYESSVPLNAAYFFVQGSTSQVSCAVCVGVNSSYHAWSYEIGSVNLRSGKSHLTIPIFVTNGIVWCPYQAIAATQDNNSNGIVDGGLYKVYLYTSSKFAVGTSIKLYVC